MRDPRARDAFNRGMSAATGQQWDVAIEAFLYVLRYDAGNSLVWYNLMCAHLQVGDDDKALGAGLRTKALNPKHPYVNLYLGNIFAKKRDYLNAVDHFLNELERDPHSLTTHVNLAGCFEQLKLFEQAYECYEMAVMLGGERSILLSSMHYVASHAVRWDWAAKTEAALMEYLEHNPNKCAPFQLFTVPGATRRHQFEAAKNHWDTMYAHIQPMPPLGPRKDVA